MDDSSTKTIYSSAGIEEGFTNKGFAELCGTVKDRIDYVSLFGETETFLFVIVVRIVHINYIMIESYEFYCY